MASIELTQVHKRHGTVLALRGIDLTVRDGELLVLVGPSGCGKSTLLRAIAGLESIDSGLVRLDGRDITHAPPSRRGMAMVFQNYALYPHMTVRENLSFGPRMRGQPRPEIEERVQRAVDMLELGSLLDRRPAELSGGQCQRVAIGRAIVQQPSVFLFDEPLSNLDAELRLRMRVEIAALHRDLRTTTLYVTHDQAEAMTLAHRLVVMRQGQIEQVGEPMEVWRRPANTFVASFIGTPAMNLLEAELRQGLVLHHGAELGRAVARPAGLATSAAAPTALPLADQAIQIGLRPEHLLPDPQGALGLQVEVIERLGAMSHLHGRCIHSGAALRLEWRLEPIPQPGQILRLRPVPGAGHVFSADGRRLADLI